MKDNIFFLEYDQILSKSMHVYYELLKITFKYKANRHDNFCHARLMHAKCLNSRKFICFG